MATEEKEIQEKSLREQLMEVRDEIEAREAPEAPPEPEGKPRDDAGRFAPKTEAKLEQAEGEVAAPAGPVESVPPQVAGKSPQPVAASEAPPSSWTPNAKAKWAELPQEIRQEIRKREADHSRAATLRNDEQTFGVEMRKVIAPYEAMMRAEGANPAQAVQAVLNTAYVLRTADPITKARAVAQVIQQYGVDLSLLGQPAASDPAVTALHSKVAQLENALTQRQQQEQEGLENQVKSAIQTFGQDAKHPHFEAVRVHMGALIQNGVAADMEQAYEMAVWANPDLRAQLVADQAQQQRADLERKQKAERARVKGSSIRGGPGGSQPPAPNPNSSVRDDLEAAFREIGGRV